MISIAEMMMYNILPVVFFTLACICFVVAFIFYSNMEYNPVIAFAFLGVISLVMGVGMMYTTDIEEISITPCNIVGGGYGYYIADENSNTYYATSVTTLKIHLNKTIHVKVMNDASKYPTIIEVEGNACLPNTTC